MECERLIFYSLTNKTLQWHDTINSSSWPNNLPKPISTYLRTSLSKMRNTRYVKNEQKSYLTRLQRLTTVGHSSQTPCLYFALLNLDKFFVITANPLMFCFFVRVIDWPIKNIKIAAYQLRAPFDLQEIMLLMLILCSLNCCFGFSNTGFSTHVVLIIYLWTCRCSKELDSIMLP